MRSALETICSHGESEAIIRLVFEHLKGWSPVDIVLHEDDALSDFMRGKVEAILSRLMQHEPIQYILGKARFYGLDFAVNRSVLVPRPETEELVEMAVRDASDEADLRVLDAGTGSGCIAIALARNLKFPQITAIDVSGEALEVARANARALRCNITFRRQDMLRLAAERDRWDIIVSNPPYIAEKEAADMEANVLDYEPHSALFVPDADPLIFYCALTDYAAASLSPGGRLYLEINPLYADALASLTAGSGLAGVELHRDIHGRNRFLTAHRVAAE